MRGFILGIFVTTLVFGALEASSDEPAPRQDRADAMRKQLPQLERRLAEAGNALSALWLMDDLKWHERVLRIAAGAEPNEGAEEAQAADDAERRLLLARTEVAAEYFLGRLRDREAAAKRLREDRGK